MSRTKLTDEEFKEVFKEVIAETALTRDQAIKRIKDIRQRKSVGHFTQHEYAYGGDLILGAELELMAIFDIKGEEL